MAATASAAAAATTPLRVLLRRSPRARTSAKSGTRAASAAARAMSCMGTSEDFRVAGPERRGKSGPAAAESGLDGADRHPEGLRDLGDRQIGQVVERERLALVVGQGAERGDEGDPVLAQVRPAGGSIGCARPSSRSPTLRRR